MEFDELVLEAGKLVLSTSEQFGLHARVNQLDALRVSMRWLQLRFFLYGAALPPPSYLQQAIQTPEQRARALFEYSQTRGFSKRSRITAAGCVVHKERAIRERELCSHIASDEFKFEIESEYGRVLSAYRSHRLTLLAYRGGHELDALGTLVHEGSIVYCMTWE